MEDSERNEQANYVEMSEISNSTSQSTSDVTRDMEGSESNEKVNDVKMSETSNNTSQSTSDVTRDMKGSERNEKVNDVKMSETSNNTSQSTSDDKEHNCLRSLLRVYFTESFKWKDSTCTINLLYIIIALVQLLKVICLSGQMITYGKDQSNFANAVHRGQITLRHLLLKNWDASWETEPYPSDHGDFAVYTIDDLESGINYAVSRYYNVDDDAAAFFKRLENDKMEVVISYFYFKDGIFGKEIIKSEKRFSIDYGLTNEIKDKTTEYSYSIVEELAFLNISEALEQMFDVTLKFTLRSLRPEYENSQVLCLHITGEVHFNDKNYNGQIEVDLTTKTHSIPCVNMNLSVKDFDLENPNTWGVPVMVFCAISMAGFLLTIIVGLLAIWKYSKVKKMELNKLPSTSYWRFIVVICGDFLQLVSDILNIIGTCMINNQKGNELEQWSLDEAVFYLGLGCVLAWLCSIRYLKITKSFSLLFETLYRAFWNVIAYLICVTVLFVGYLFCGYVVLGPYHVKFRTLSVTAETLFALSDGDELYATFALFEADQPGNTLVQGFARFYLGSYAFIFHVVAINLLIALFNSAYETIQIQNDTKTKSQVEKAIKRVYNQKQQTDLKTALQNHTTDQNCTEEDKELKKLLKDLCSSEKRFETLDSFLEDHEYFKECCCCCSCCFRCCTVISIPKMKVAHVS